MFKRIITIVIFSVLLISCAGCGNKIKNKESVSVKETENISNYALNAIPLSKEVVFEKDGVKVLLKEILYEKYTTKIMFHINNKIEENIKILVTDLAINGLMNTETMMIDVEKETEKDACIEISNEWFSELNIDAIKELEFLVRVLDENSVEKFKSDILKAETKAPISFNQQYDDDGFIIYSKNGINLLARELKKSKLSNDFELVFFVENNTGTQFSIVAEDVKVNQRPIDHTFIMTVGAKKKAVDTMLFEESALKSIKADEIKTVEASFRAFSDSLETVFETENIQIPIK